MNKSYHNIGTGKNVYVIHSNINRKYSVNKLSNKNKLSSTNINKSIDSLLSNDLKIILKCFEKLKSYYNKMKLLRLYFQFLFNYIENEYNETNLIINKFQCMRYMSKLQAYTKNSQNQTTRMNFITLWNNFYKSKKVFLYIKKRLNYANIKNNSYDKLFVLSNIPSNYHLIRSIKLLIHYWRLSTYHNKKLKYKSFQYWYKLSICMKYLNYFGYYQLYHCFKRFKRKCKIPFIIQISNKKVLNKYVNKWINYAVYKFRYKNFNNNSVSKYIYKHYISKWLKYNTSKRLISNLTNKSIKYLRLKKLPNFLNNWINHFYIHIHNKYNNQLSIRYYNDKTLRKYLLILKIFCNNKYRNNLKIKKAFRYGIRYKYILYFFNKLKHYTILNTRIKILTIQANQLSRYKTPIGKWLTWLINKSKYKLKSNKLIYKYLMYKLKSFHTNRCYYNNIIENSDRYYNYYTLKKYMKKLYIYSSNYQYRWNICKYIQKKKFLLSFVKNYYLLKDQNLIIYRCLIRYKIKLLHKYFHQFLYYTIKNMKLKFYYKVYRRKHPWPMNNLIRKVFSHWKCIYVPLIKSIKRKHNQLKNKIQKNKLKILFLKLYNLFLYRKKLNYVFKKLTKNTNSNRYIWMKIKNRYLYRYNTRSYSDDNEIKSNYRHMLTNCLTDSVTSKQFIKSIKYNRIFKMWLFHTISSKNLNRQMKHFIELNSKKCSELCRHIYQIRHNNKLNITIKYLNKWLSIHKLKCRAIWNIRIKYFGRRIFNNWLSLYNKNLIQKYIVNKSVNRSNQSINLINNVSIDGKSNHDNSSNRYMKSTISSNRNNYYLQYKNNQSNISTLSNSYITTISMNPTSYDDDCSVDSLNNDMNSCNNKLSVKKFSNSLTNKIKINSKYSNENDITANRLEVKAPLTIDSYDSYNAIRKSYTSAYYFKKVNKNKR